MAKTRGDLLSTLAQKLVGKMQLYGFLTDSAGSPILNDGNEQVKEIEVGANGRLKVDASIAGSLANAPTATIAINTALSSAVDLANNTLVAITMPATWTVANITFDVSNDGTNYGPLYYQGSEFILSEASASRRITVDPVALMPWRYLKVRSGTAGTPVNQTAQSVVQLWTKPVV